MAKTNSSLMGLLLEQQSNGLGGLRVSLLSNLADPLELSKHPYHYCGMQKRLDLALWLYQQGVPLDSLPVASVSADGLQGTTGWTKVLNVSPKEAALLAGHACMSVALGHMEGGVPLEWTAENHRQFPAAFRSEAAQMVGALSTSGWFTALPGPARSAVVARAMQLMCRTGVWGVAEPSMWASKGVSAPLCSDPLEAEALATLLPAPGGPFQPHPATGDTASSAAGLHAPPPADPAAANAEADADAATHATYHIHVGTARVTHEVKPWVCAMLKWVAVPMLLGVVVGRLRCRPMPRLALAAAAGAVSTLGTAPWLTLVLAQLLWGPSLQSL